MLGFQRTLSVSRKHRRSNFDLNFCGLEERLSLGQLALSFGAMAGMISVPGAGPAVLVPIATAPSNRPPVGKFGPTLEPLFPLQPGDQPEPTFPWLKPEMKLH